MFDGDTAVTSLGERTWVEDRRMVDGHDSYDIRSEGCLRAEVIPERYYGAFDDGISFLHTKVPNGSTVCYKVDVWLSRDVPYPILYQEEIFVEGKTRHEYLENLAGLKSGTVPIPWTDAATANSAPAAFELTEGPQRYPGDGAGGRLPYRLSEDLAAVEGDLSLLAFHRWRLSHADAILVGAELKPLNADRLEWDLIYGSPGGSAFGVSSERSVPLGTTDNTENGEFPSRPFDVEEFPQHQMTIGAAEALWVRNARDVAEPPAPNSLKWGFLYRDPAVLYPSTELSSAQLIDTWGGTVIWVGNLPPTQIASAAYVERPTAPQLVSAIFAHSAPADLWISVHGAQDIDFTPMNVAGAIPKDPPAKAGSAAGTPFTPDLAIAVLVSSSLVGGLLAAYFLPLWRFFGASAVGAIFGYSKLQRSGLLEQKTRNDLEALIRREPGISMSDLAKTVAAGWSTTVYHLRVLEKNQMISSLVDGRNKRFFPVEGLDWSRRGRLSVLRNARTRELYETILGEPGVIQVALARRAGISKPGVSWHLRRLEGVGLVGHDKLGRRVHYYPAGPVEPVAAAATMEVA